MKRKLAMLLAGVMLVGSILSGCGGSEEPAAAITTADGELEGDITFWHSFTQGPRLETIQKAADEFMEENPKLEFIYALNLSFDDLFTRPFTIFPLPNDIFSKIFSSGGTLTIQLYLSAQKGDFDIAFGIAVVLLVIVLLINAATKLLTSKFDVTREKK